LDQRHAAPDSSVFSTHSVRGASSSAALSKEIHIADILTMADCTLSGGFTTILQEMIANGY